MPPRPGTPRAPRTGVSIEWLPASDRASAERIWTALEASLKRDALACSWVWTGTWLEHYGDLVPHRFAVGAAHGAPCGIALVTAGVDRRRGPFRVRSRHLGTAGEPPADSAYVEYNRILVEDQRRQAFSRALLAELARDPVWHELTLDGFAPEEAEPLLAVEPGLVARRELCRIIDLRAADRTGGDVLDTLSSRMRKQMRRSLRGLDALESDWAETPEQALEIFDELVRLHQAQWVRAGQPGVFASHRFTAFHRALVPRLAARRAVILFRIRSPGGTIACEYGFIERGRALAYQSGRAIHPDRQVRLGLVSDVVCSQACYDHGLREYDFLAGDSIHKRQLATGQRELVWATWRRPSRRWQAIELMATVKRRASAAPWVRPLRARRPKLHCPGPGTNEDGQSAS